MGVLSGVKDVLFPNAVGLVLDRLTEVGGVVVADAHSAVTELRCPDCATASRRVHSRYGRRFTEHPAGGRRLVAKLEVRRFFCDAPDCGRRTFVEQIRISNSSSRRPTSSTVPNCQVPEVTTDHFRATFRSPTRP
jgi:transposase